MVRKINARLVLRLRSQGLSFAQIEAQGVSRHSVGRVPWGGVNFGSLCVGVTDK